MVVYAAGMIVCHNENLWVELWHNLQYLPPECFQCNACIWMIPGTESYADDGAPSRMALYGA